MKYYWRKLFKEDYYRNTEGKKYNFLKYHFMSYQNKVLYWFRRAHSNKRIFSRIYYHLISKKHGNEISRQDATEGYVTWPIE